MNLAEFEDFCTPEIISNMTQPARLELLTILGVAKTWMPIAGPQQRAVECKADILFYGGQAGGGKTDMLCGLATGRHMKTLLLRKQSTQLTGIVDRLKQMIGGRCYNGTTKIFRPKDSRQIELGSLNNKGDEEGYMGRPHDLLGVDEVCHFPRWQIEFLMGWVRTTDPTAPKPRVIFTGNPPTSSIGLWVREYFAPWLDPNYPDPAEDGELRWFTTIGGRDVECIDGEPFEYTDPKTGEIEWISAKSRTFIRSSIDDNPYFNNTGYKAQLQALPEPLRSKMLKGDFGIDTDDDAMQVIPTEWVQAAMDRWEPRTVKGTMDSMGVDVACGGIDDTVLSCRHGHWFDELERHAGAGTPNGQTTAGLVMMTRRDLCPVHVDVIGWGKSAFDFLDCNGVQAVPINNASTKESKHQTTKKTNPKDPGLRFRNQRALDNWRLREALDPESGLGIELPPDPKLKADLTSARWELTQGGILVESKDQIKERLGRSPDSGDAVVMANKCTPRIDVDKNKDNAIPEAWSPYT